MRPWKVLVTEAFRGRRSFPERYRPGPEALPPIRPAPALRRRTVARFFLSREVLSFHRPRMPSVPSALFRGRGRRLRLAPGFLRVGRAGNDRGALLTENERERVPRQSGSSGGCYNGPPPGPARPALLRRLAFCTVVSPCVTEGQRSRAVPPSPKGGGLSSGRLNYTRQDHHPAHHRGLRDPGRGLVLLPGRGHRLAPAAPAQREHGVPALRPLPAPERV